MIICGICGNSKTVTTKGIIRSIFPKPQEYLNKNCTNCGNLVYNYCRNKGG